MSSKFHYNLQREIIQLYIGQCGVQTASACWELFCLEHGILADGTVCQPNDCETDSSAIFDSYYCSDSKKFQCVPRAVIIDSEATCIDEIRTGCYRKLFNPSSFVNGKECAASNFAKGFNDIGNGLGDVCLDQIRKFSEECDNLQVGLGLVCLWGMRTEIVFVQKLIKKSYFLRAL